MAEINIKINTGNSDKELASLVKQLQQVQSQAQGVQSQGSGLSNFFNSSLTGSIGNAAKAVAGLGAGFLAISSIKSFFGNAIEESIQNEQALNRLSQALKATGSFSEGAVENFKNFADQLQATSLHQGDAILQNIALAKAMGASNSQAQQLVQAAAELSATFGGSLEDNTEKLGKALNGNLGKLAQTIPELKNFTAEQLKAGAATEFINSKFSGAAASQINGYAGSLNTLGDAWRDLQQKIGDVITQSTITEDAIGGVANIINFFSRQIDNLNFLLGDGEISMSQYTKAIDDQKIKLQELSVAMVQVAMARANDGLATAEDVKKWEDSTFAILENLDALEKAQAKMLDNKDPNKNKRGGSAVDEEARKAQEELNNKIYDANADAWKAEQELKAQQQLADAEAQAINDQQRLEALHNFNLEQIRINEEYANIKNVSLGNEQLTTLANEKANSEAKLAIFKSEIDKKKNLQKFEEAQNKSRVQDQRSTLSTIASLANSNNDKLAAIGKAAAITQIAIDTPVAISKALAAFPPPFNFAAAGAVGIAMAAQAAQIAGVQLEDGGRPDGMGRLPGSSVRGDIHPFWGNAGEVVLNQKEVRVLRENFGGGFNSLITTEILQSINNKIGTPPVVMISGTILNEELTRINSLRLA